MTEIEVAAGAAIAASDAASVALKRTQDNQESTVSGSRARTCANANSPLIHEAVALLQKAARLLCDASDRHNRMNEL